MTRVVLPVEGMTCDECAQSVQQALQNMPGVEDVEVSLTGNCAGIVYDGEIVGEYNLKAAIRKAGLETY